MLGVNGKPLDLSTVATSRLIGALANEEVLITLHDSVWPEHVRTPADLGHPVSPASLAYIADLTARCRVLAEAAARELDVRIPRRRAEPE